MTFKFYATWLGPIEGIEPREGQFARKPPDTGGARTRRPVVIKGKFYRSMTEAMAETGLGVRAIYRLMGEGWRT